MTACERALNPILDLRGNPDGSGHRRSKVYLDISLLHSRLPLVLTINGRVADAATECVSVGGYVLVLSTAIAERDAPFDLHSTYVGHRDGETAVTHLELRPGVSGGTLECSRQHRAALSVGADDRSACLHDHLQRLLDVLQGAGLTATVQLDDAAVATLRR